MESNETEKSTSTEDDVTDSDATPASKVGVRDKSAKARRRKSNRPYPPSSFEEAVKFVREVYEFNSGLAVRKLSFFDHLGRSPDSSASRDAITNANKYGLIKSSFAAEQIEITDNGLSVVADDIPAREKARAMVRLGVESIETFNNVYQRLAGNRLPARSALIDSMRDAGIPEDLVEEAVDIFIINLRFVGLLQVLSGADRVVTVDLLLDNLPSAVSPNRAMETARVSPNVADTASSAASSDVKMEDTCFYITPIGATGSDARKHSDLFLGSIVEPAMSSLGLNVVRADMIGQPGIITRQVLELILKSRLVVADLSFHNPNVFYELALRHAIRKPVVQIVRQADSIPFDINQMRTIAIGNTDLYSFVPNIEIYKAEIAAQARRALDNSYEVDTPISVYFPTLRVNMD